MKSGIRTSEFYLTILSILLLFSSQALDLEFDEKIMTEGILGLIAFIQTILYTIGRIKLKLEEMRKG